MKLSSLIKKSYDSRYSPFVQEKRVTDWDAIKGYLSGKYDILGSAEDSLYKVIIIDSPERANLYVKKDDPRHPVPAGKWMNLWESDLDVSQKEWTNYSIKERATLECKLQLKKWIRKEYYELYASIYLEDEYDKWWWNENGSRMNMIERNNYWKNRIKELKIS